MGGDGGKSARNGPAGGLRGWISGGKRAVGVRGQKKSDCGGNRIGLRRRFRRGNGSRKAYASGAIALVIFPTSFQPSICWRVRMKITLPGVGTPYRAT